MYQFFVEAEQVLDLEQEIVITGADVNHIGKVLRMRTGEKIRVSSADGRSFFCRITRIDKEQVRAEIDCVDVIGTELPNKIYLFQGLPKSDKMEFIIQKAVELGVCEIIPVAMKNCVVKLDERKSESRADRWQAIARSAAKQSKRTIVPHVHVPVNWEEAMRLGKELDLILVPYENEQGMSATRKIIGNIQKGQSVGIMIGPEGGFSGEEIEKVSQQEFMHKISLGKRILRTETAGLAALSMLIYELDD